MYGFRADVYNNPYRTDRQGHQHCEFLPGGTISVCVCVCGGGGGVLDFLNILFFALLLLYDLVHDVEAIII